MHFQDSHSVCVYSTEVTWQKRKTIKKTKMKKRQPSPHSSIKLPLFGYCHICCLHTGNSIYHGIFWTHFLFVKDVVSHFKGCHLYGGGGAFNRAHDMSDCHNHDRRYDSAKKHTDLYLLFKMILFKTIAP